MTKIPLFFLRTLFGFLSLFLMGRMVFHETVAPSGQTLLLASACTFLLFFSLFSLERLFFKLSFSRMILPFLGLFIGYLLASLLLQLFMLFFQIAYFNLDSHLAVFCKISLSLFGLYLGILLAYRFAKELRITLPFLTSPRSKDPAKGLLLDGSALQDPRLFDLLALGLLNRKVVIPRFYLNKLQMDFRCSEERTQQQAKRTLETLKKIESLPHLTLSYRESECLESKTSLIKMVDFARLFDTDLLISDTENTHTEVDGVKIFNLHTLSKVLMPIKQQGEPLTIKIQRTGKEELQGVGYLDDGTMVVVNGGGEHLGEIVEARVLSIKNTQTGRLIFCNLAEGQ